MFLGEAGKGIPPSAVFPLVEKEEIEKRGLTPQDVLIASLLAGLREMGVLNQAVVLLAMERAGKYLFRYAKVVNLVKGGESVEEAFEALKKVFPPSLEMNISEENGRYVVEVKTELCKICPRAIGELELPGSLCPTVGIIKGFLEETCGVKLSPVIRNGTLVEKSEEKCKFIYEVEA